MAKTLFKALSEIPRRISCGDYKTIWLGQERAKSPSLAPLGCRHPPTGNRSRRVSRRTGVVVTDRMQDPRVVLSITDMH